MRHSEQGKINKLSETEKAYIAGMIDADGCVGIAKNKGRWVRFEYNFNVRVVVANSNLELIFKLRDIIGAGTSAVRESKNPKWRAVHHYQITGLKAQALLKEVVPYMIVKRERSKELLKFPFPPNKKGKMVGGDYQGRTKEMYIKQFELFEKLRKLNKRGT